MTRLSEDLLRASLTDAAATVDRATVRPLPAQVPRRRRRAMVLAGAAIAVVTVLAVLIPWPRLAGERPNDPMAYAGVKFVVEGAWPPGKRTVTVRDTTSGKTVAEVHAPAGSSGFRYSTAAGDGTTYFLTTADACRIHFYRLTLRSNGTPVSLTEVASIRGAASISHEPLAATRDGRTLAFTRPGCGTGRQAQAIAVVNLTNGTSRDLPLPPGVEAGELTWAPDRRHLVFRSSADGWDGPKLQTVDTRTAAITDLPLPPGATLAAAVFDPSGNDVLALIRRAGEHRLVWYSLTTRTPVHEALLHSGSPNSQILIGPSGDSTFAWIDGHVYRIKGRTITRD